MAEGGSTYGFIDTFGDTTQTTYFDGSGTILGYKTVSSYPDPDGSSSGTSTVFSDPDWNWVGNSWSDSVSSGSILGQPLSMTKVQPITRLTMRNTFRKLVTARSVLKNMFMSSITQRMPMAPWAISLADMKS